ncbi:transporter substrate-binding domain-containing protein [Paraglaciecola aquimarina]|uniref:Transporter substrate-binding domain-containing protein n=1 Tax=Paraglaciecola aquimarina TaxID=1235557 RepID=A0ABU3SUP7_9ALTE|nr:transporter substrate-binding domain-containing protein [Paraglaciecola aquimarina]MDU0353718.1 transporter substrate-binding domain-containing protein [Paraglaciecola aquimarina]
MPKTTASALLWLCCGFLFSYNSYANEIRFLSHSIKPFTYDEKGEMKGFAVEIVETLMERTNTREKISLYPFKRALKNVQSKDDHALFIVARIPERENTVKWVGPIFSSDVYFYKKKGSAISIRSIDDIRKVRSIGVQLGNADFTYLTGLGVTNFSQTISHTQSIKMLNKGRIDITPISEFVLPYVTAEAGIDINNFERINFKLYESSLYIAFSKNVPNETIVAWQNALTSIKSSGLYAEIYQKYSD